MLGDRQNFLRTKQGTGNNPWLETPMRICSITWSVIAIVCGLSVAEPASADKTSRPPDPCDKGQVSIDDVRDILAGKATVNHYSMSESTPGEGCSIGVAGKGFALVDISMREGDLQSYQNLIIFVPKPHTSMPGIGDEAFSTATKESNMPNAKETDLFARKGRLQCIAQLHRSNGDGEKLVIPTTDAAVAAKLGALCKKLFAAHSGT
jgi:hypothetical protein